MSEHPWNEFLVEKEMPLVSHSESRAEMLKERKMTLKG